ncbi:MULTISPECIES: biotin/lipoyl-containing protein [Pseudomonas]|uniref:acetyl-CoA carboxylase biotin carboxyl carrier protein n=1 Tax=Pseudomonas TaxID=286 RepID=UPI00086375C4|nr:MULTISPECIES: biotin/lipoyl-containing protein [Pseudomonas]PNG88216.1 acetyl-CoA carboxylase biotin carboxyl carrier protein subunit [Pseudomonas putida]
MNLTDIEKFAQLVERRGISFLEFEEDGACLSLTATPTIAAPTPSESEAPQPAPVSKADVLSPGMGVVRLQHPQRENLVIAQGQQVAAGDVIGWLEYGDVLTEICAAHSGVISSVKVADGDVVGFAQLIIDLE